MSLRVASARKLRGSVQVPPDKSISHRAVVLAALGDGISRISNYLDGRDTALTLQALRQLGIQVSEEPDALLISGTGTEGMRESSDVLNVGMSAATMRFIAGLVAPEPFLSVLVGDPRTHQRPMSRIVEPLKAMGAEVLAANGDTTAPLIVRGGQLYGVDWTLPVASGEAKTAVLLAGLRADGSTTVRTPLPCRDHTERLLRAMGLVVENTDPCAVTISGRRTLSPLEFRIPGEMSVAVYWLVAGSVHPDADITISDVCMNPMRTGLIDALNDMGARIEVLDVTDGIEQVATLRVRSAQLHGTSITPEMIPRMVDELPGFILAACLADGPTEVRGAADLRSKKSNRLETVAGEYRKLGAEIDVHEDGMTIHGRAELWGTVTSSHGDHRLGNSLAIAGLVAQGVTIVEDDAVIAGTSYPNFIEDLRRLAS